MSACTNRMALQDWAGEIVELVIEGSTAEQWAEWLRVPLEHAARKGNIDLVKILLRSGANGSAGCRGGCNGGTLLGAGAVGGSEEVVIALLEAGGNADLDIPLPEHGNGCPLHIAIARGAEGAARALIIAGADVGSVNDQERSPLHLVAELGQHGLVGDLLLRGARPDAKDSGGDTPLHLAADGGHIQSVSVLLASGADRDSLDGKEHTPLVRAVAGDSPQAAETLVAAGADIHHRSSVDDVSALDAAARKGHLDIVRMLTSNGADVSGAGRAGLTPLLFAVFGTDPTTKPFVIRYLIEAGADTEARVILEWTVLSLAANQPSGYLGSVLVLLEGGADVNAQTLSGTTPLHDGCSNSKVDLVELLLRWGADETVTDENGNTAVDAVGSLNLGNEADNDRIRRMLARAPADRSWRRRSCLVLCRTCPDRVSLTSGSGRTAASGKGRDGDNGLAKLARTGRECDGSVEGEGGWSEGGGDDSMAGLRSVAARVVGLQVDGIFRKVVGYL